MTWPITSLILGLVLLFLGGEGLVRGSSSLALRLGLTPLVVGLTVVAFGTSAPEMVVSVQAALIGQGDIAVGNVVGSNILNIGLILGLTAIIYPLKVRLQILRIDVPILIAVTLIAGWMLKDSALTRPEGAALTAGLLAYIVFTVIYARREPPSAVVADVYAEAVPAPVGSVWRDVIFIAVGLALLIAGSDFLVKGAVTLARSFGISEAIIGLTIVSVGTSMPELVTCIVAALKKEPDIAVGNIIGSNLFNILGILGIGSIIAPMVASGIKRSDLFVALAFTVVLVPILWTDFKLQRWEGILLLATYAAYVSWLWPN